MRAAIVVERCKRAMAAATRAVENERAAPVVAIAASASNLRPKAARSWQCGGRPRGAPRHHARQRERFCRFSPMIRILRACFRLASPPPPCGARCQSSPPALTRQSRARSTRARTRIALAPPASWTATGHLGASARARANFVYARAACARCWRRRRRRRRNGGTMRALCDHDIRARTRTTSARNGDDSSRRPFGRLQHESARASNEQLCAS